ncbi:MAG: hypothetical protein JO252_09780, partial [Planctomycetaceae bacterium]|nr:hypothetical protein [Planctomycetaceae bacterium]
LVLTAVIAEGPDDRAPDVWGDLAATVARAGDTSGRLWVDDSKAILRAGKGRDRLELVCLAAVAAAGRVIPRSLGGLLAALDVGTLAEAELSPWLDGGDPELPGHGARALLDRATAPRALEEASWRIAGVRSVVVGPARFNAGLVRSGSKAKVHFAAFARLLGALWERAADGVVTHVCSDKHGGRHFYLHPLREAFPDTAIDPGPEGPALSRYMLQAPGRRLELSLLPRADAKDGLVALASIVSKTVRECWMDAFNAHWTARIPGLRPTAGYPVDAARFRRAIEPECLARGLDPSVWWRIK